MPVTPAPLERTDRAPWVWVTAQARRAQVDPRALAAALRSDDRIDAVLFLRVAEQATVDRECRSAVRALRDRSAVTFEVDQVPEATD